MSRYVRPGYPTRARAFSLDTPPASPHAYDDEFDAGSLDAKWTRMGTVDNVNAIDQYAAFASPAGWRWSMNSFRKSWFMVQPDTRSGANLTARLTQAVTLPTDCFMWARMSFNARYNAMTANDSRVGILFLASSAGLPDDNNRAFMYLNLSGTNTVVATGGCTSAGAAASSSTKNVGPQTVGTDSLSQAACYVGIQKISTTYQFLLGWPNGNWNILASQTLAATMAFIGVDFINGGTTTPGNMIMGLDFLRFYAGRIIP